MKTKKPRELTDEEIAELKRKYTEFRKKYNSDGIVEGNLDNLKQQT